MTTLTVALVGLALAAVGSLGHRFQLLPFRPAFALLGLGFLAMLIALVMGIVRVVVMLMRHQPERMGLVVGGVVVPLLVLEIPVFLMVSPQRASQGVPAIHDITPETVDPPVFVDVLALR